MIDYNEAIRSNDLKVLEKEIAERKELLNLMVGNLYPPLVRGQVVELVKRKAEIESLCEFNKEYLLEKWKK